MKIGNPYDSTLTWTCLIPYIMHKLLMECTWARFIGRQNMCVIVCDGRCMTFWHPTSCMVYQTSYDLAKNDVLRDFIRKLGAYSCSVLQCVVAVCCCTVCCIVLQCVVALCDALCCSVLLHCVLQCVAVSCYSMLFLCVAVCSVLL